MPVMFRLWIGIVVLIGLGNCSTLLEFHEQFANRSVGNTEQVQMKWVQNGLLNGELNVQIVIHLGEMVHRMREANAKVYRLLSETDTLDDSCREYLEWYYQLTLPLQNRDVQLCAIYAYSDLYADGIKRFRPRAKYLQRANSRVLHQVVRSFGERGTLDIEGTLADELASYDELIDEQMVLLQKDLDDQSDLVQETLYELEDCRRWNYLFQDNDHGHIKGQIESNCE